MVFIWADECLFRANGHEACLLYDGLMIVHVGAHGHEAVAL